VIFVIVIFLAFVAGLGYAKYRGAQALTFIYVDVAGLTLDEIIKIGTEASRSLTGRLSRSIPPVRRTENVAEWQAQIQGSVMSFSVKGLPGGKGYRIGGSATKMRIAQTRIGSNTGTWGLSKAISNAICRALGIPHNASALVARRKRVLRAVAKAGTLIQPSLGQQPSAMSVETPQKFL
jgi:hypothetical protein